MTRSVLEDGVSSGATSFGLAILFGALGSPIGWGVLAVGAVVGTTAGALAAVKAEADAEAARRANKAGLERALQEAGEVVARTFLGYIGQRERRAEVAESTSFSGRRGEAAVVAE
jgi:hypothetical protein